MMGLRQNREIILEYPDGPNIITWTLKVEVAGRSQRDTAQER